MKQRCIGLDAHDIGDRNTDKKGSQNSLDHNKSCFTDSIIESGITEEDCCKQTVNRIGLQVVGCCQNYFGIR